MKFKIGQTVFVHMNERKHHANFEALVESVGRKWVSIGVGYRFDKNTMELDGGQYSSPGRVYLCRQDYEDEKEAEAICRELEIFFFRNATRSKVNLTTLRSIKTLLGLE